MAESKTVTVGEMRERLVSRASTDTEFRAQLMEDPGAAIKAELGVSVPAGFTIEVHEESADSGHLVLPPSADLSEAELERASGASIWDNASIHPR